MSGAFVIIGLPILLIGLVTLFRPGLARGVLSLPDTEASTYALRIAGVMIAAFGLILAGFSIAFQLSAPTGVAQ